MIESYNEADPRLMRSPECKRGEDYDESVLDTRWSKRTRIDADGLSVWMTINEEDTYARLGTIVHGDGNAL